jgi:hypothetical protein
MTDDTIACGFFVAFELLNAASYLRLWWSGPRGEVTGAENFLSYVSGIWGMVSGMKILKPPAWSPVTNGSWRYNEPLK